MYFFTMPTDGSVTCKKCGRRGYYKFEICSHCRKVNCHLCKKRFTPSKHITAECASCHNRKKSKDMRLSHEVL